VIRHDCEQGSAEWHRLRLGCLTASRCKPLVTATGKVSTGQGIETLVNKLVFETVTGQPSEDFSTDVVERGSRLEAEARAALAWEEGIEIETVGFLTDESGRVGCSPDGLADGVGVEIKNPMGPTQIGYVRDHGLLLATYAHQVQTSLLVTGFEEWILFAHSPSPRIPNVTLRVGRDEDYIAALREAISGILARVDEALAVIERLCPAESRTPFD